jgi:hypothetical protein
MTVLHPLRRDRSGFSRGDRRGVGRGGISYGQVTVVAATINAK